MQDNQLVDAGASNPPTTLLWISGMILAFLQEPVKEIGDYMGLIVQVLSIASFATVIIINIPKVEETIKMYKQRWSNRKNKNDGQG